MFLIIIIIIYLLLFCGTTKHHKLIINNLIITVVGVYIFGTWCVPLFYFGNCMILFRRDDTYDIHYVVWVFFFVEIFTFY